MSLSTDLPLAARPTRVRYLVVAALCVAAAVAYVQRNSYGGAETTIRADLHLTPAQTGDAAGLFFLLYAVLQAPAGWLAQRLGPRPTIVCCAVGWSLSLALCAFAAVPHTLIGGRLLMGVFQAGLLPSATIILASWLPSTQRGTAGGLLNSFMLIGAALNANFTGLLIDPIGWRGLFLIYSIPGLIWALLFLAWFRNRPADHPAVNDAELAVIGCPPRTWPPAWTSSRTAPSSSYNIATTASSGLQTDHDPVEDAVATPPVVRPAMETQEAPDADLAPAVRQGRPNVLRPAVSWGILLSGALYCICLQQFFRSGANRFIDFSLPTYLQEVRHVGKELANQLSSLPQWGGVVGGTLGGLLSDWLLARTGSRRVARQGLAVVSLVGTLAVYAVAYVVPDVTVAMVLFSLGMMIFFFSATCAYAITMDMGGANLGVVFGLMNMAGNFGAYAFTAVVPRLNAHFGNDWTPTLLLFAAMHVAALVFWLPLNPNGVIGERQPAPEPKE